MLNKTDNNRMTALYYRTARRDRNPESHLDNQMQKLLYYAKGFDNFVLYADRGVSGNTPTRPALNALKADIAAGFIDRIVVNDTSRIARDMTLLMRFTEWAAHRAEIISISEGAHMERFYADVYGSMYRALTERGQGYD